MDQSPKEFLDFFVRISCSQACPDFTLGWALPIGPHALVLDFSDIFRCPQQGKLESKGLAELRDELDLNVCEPVVVLSEIVSR